LKSGVGRNRGVRLHHEQDRLRLVQPIFLNLSLVAFSHVDHGATLAQ
jgi:hypothetical protein